MRIVVSGDVRRPGQEINILRLHARIHEHLHEAFGVAPGLERGKPVPFDAWVREYETAEYPVSADLLIGFELPPGARRDLPRWINVQRHPVRFVGEYYSITSNVPGVAEVVSRCAEVVEAPAATRRQTTGRGAGVLTLQVHNDSSLIRDGRFTGPWAFVAPLQEWADGCRLVAIAPHPLEPESPWRDCLRDLLPGAHWVEPGAYAAFRTVERMATISSSTGVEAPYFGVEPRFLWREPERSAPVNLDRRDLWAGIAEACGD